MFCLKKITTKQHKIKPQTSRRALRGYQRRQWEATTVQPFPSVEHEDAFLLFRALCKLSQRPDHAGPGDGLAVAPTAEEARQMESKAVSLVSGSGSACQPLSSGSWGGGLRRVRWNTCCFSLDLGPVFRSGLVFLHLVVLLRRPPSELPRFCFLCTTHPSSTE